MSASTVRPSSDLRIGMLAVFVLAVVLVSGVGSLSSVGAVDGWYSTAERPPFVPPNWVFGPVWTVLYAGLAIAAWRLSRYRDVAPARARAALRLWWAQLAFNFAWTPVFFAAEQLWLALGVILVLDGLVAVLLVRAWRLDRFAAALLVPYLAWIGFATYLNAGFALLN